MKRQDTAQIVLPTYSKGDQVKYRKYKKCIELTCKVVSYTESGNEEEGFYKIVDELGRLYSVTPSQLRGC